MFFKRGYGLYGATDTDLSSTTLLGVNAAAFYYCSYYIGDSENIEQMQNKLYILLLDTEHSEIRGYGLYKKRYHIQTNIIKKHTCYINKPSHFYYCYSFILKNELF